MSLSNQVNKMIEGEVAYWTALYEKDDGIKRIALHGAMCEVKLIQHLPEISREILVKRYNLIKSRKLDTKFYELMVTSKSRDKKRLEAIKRIGEKLKKIIDNQ